MAAFAADIQILEPVGAEFAPNAPQMVRSLVQASVSQSGNTPVDGAAELQLGVVLFLDEFQIKDQEGLLVDGLEFRPEHLDTAEIRGDILGDHTALLDERRDLSARETDAEIGDRASIAVEGALYTPPKGGFLRVGLEVDGIGADLRG